MEFADGAHACCCWIAATAETALPTAEQKSLLARIMEAERREEDVKHVTTLMFS